MAENLGPEHRTLSYTTAIVCIILEINLMLQFVPKNIVYEASSQSTLYSSLLLGKNLSCLPPTQPSELSPLLGLISGIPMPFNNWAQLPSQ